MERHRFLISICGGSNPSTPKIEKKRKRMKKIGAQNFTTPSNSKNPNLVKSKSLHKVLEILPTIQFPEDKQNLSENITHIFQEILKTCPSLNTYKAKALEDTRFSKTAKLCIKTWTLHQLIHGKELISPAFVGVPERNDIITPFLYGRSAGWEVLDLDFFLPQVYRVGALLRLTFMRKGKVLIISNNPLHSQILQEVAKRSGQILVGSGWTHGLLTNWKQVQPQFFQKKKKKGNSFTNKSLAQSFVQSTNQKKSYPKSVKPYTKNTRLLVPLKKKKTLALPTFVLVIDPDQHQDAILEAKKINIPVISFLPLGAKAHSVDYLLPVPGELTPYLYWFCQQMVGWKYQAKKMALDINKALQLNRNERLAEKKKRKISSYKAFHKTKVQNFRDWSSFFKQLEIRYPTKFRAL